MKRNIREASWHVLWPHRRTKRSRKREAFFPSAKGVPHLDDCPLVVEIWPRLTQFIGRLHIGHRHLHIMLWFTVYQIWKKKEIYFKVKISIYFFFFRIHQKKMRSEKNMNNFFLKRSAPLWLLQRSLQVTCFILGPDMYDVLDQHKVKMIEIQVKTTSRVGSRSRSGTKL